MLRVLLALAPVFAAPLPAIASGVSFDGNFLWNNDGGAAQIEADPADGGSTQDFVDAWFAGNTVADPRYLSTYTRVEGPWRLADDSPAIWYPGETDLRQLREVDPFFANTFFAGAFFRSVSPSWESGWIYTNLYGGTGRTDVDLGRPPLVVSGRIEPGTVWDTQFRYVLSGRVSVPAGVTLRIDAGVHVFAQPGTGAYLTVERGGRIEAEGTAVDPIIFTSGAPFGSMRPGDWGGILVHGRAVAICDVDPGAGVDCRTTGSADGSNVCVNSGTGDHFGGDDDADDSGMLRYVRSEYAGAAISPGVELPSFGFHALGTGTTLDHLQAFLGDGVLFRWCGGVVRSSHFVALEGDDDGFRWEMGYRGLHQWALIAARGVDVEPGRRLDPDDGLDLVHAGSECPGTTCGVLANATVIGGNDRRGRESQGVVMRGGGGGAVFNSIVVDFAGPGFAMQDSLTFALGPGPRPGPRQISSSVEAVAGLDVAFGPTPVRDGLGAFRFALERTAHVDIRVFDTRGREVAVVFTGRLRSGTHTVPWTSKELVPGTYFYRVDVGGEIGSGKIAVLR